MFWYFKKRKIKQMFVKEVESYVDSLRMYKEKAGAESFAFEKRMVDMKKKMEHLQETMKNRQHKEQLNWLILSIDEYIALSKFAKQTLTGHEKGFKKIQKHQEKAIQYYHQFSQK